MRNGVKNEIANDYSSDTHLKDNWELILLNTSESIGIKYKWLQIEDKFLTDGYIIS